MNILTYGNDKRVSVCRYRIEERLERMTDPVPDLSRILLLPIPSSKDEKTVNGTNIPLSDLLPLAAPGTLTVGYGLPDAFRLGIRERGGLIADVSRDEEFGRENAALSALGVLGYLLNTSPCAPADLTVGIVGYGRIGRELLRMLLFLGADVRVYSGKETVCHELGKYGVPAVRVCYGRDEKTDFSGLSVLVNTAPARLVRAEDLPDPPPRILEVASGDNLPASLPVERLPSLPGRMYPESAGIAYADAVFRMLLGTPTKKGAESK